MAVIDSPVIVLRRCWRISDI